MSYWYFSKYAWVIPLKDKRSFTITNLMQKILDESNFKQINISVDKGNKYYIFLIIVRKECYIEMYSTHNEGKSFFAERFIRILNNNIYMTSILKNVYIDKLDDIVNKYNNGYHSTIKMKYVDVKSTAYIDARK